MKHVEITRTQYTIGDFVSWQKSKSLTLSPSFQRRAVWKAGAKSYLIDTILRGLPVPILFLRDRKTNLKTLSTEREIVDGQQRIRTVLSYVSPGLLPDYNEETDDFFIRGVHNKELANKRFSDLSPLLQQRLLDYQFSVHVLPSSVADQEVLQIFARMNATGVKLNDQELRNANFFGEFKTLSYALAAEYLDQWRTWGVFTEGNIARMNEVELTSEFLMLIARGVTAKSQRSIDKSYEDWDDEFPFQDEIERRFRHVMDTVDDFFGTDLANSPLSSRTQFFALFCSIYYLSYGVEGTLKRSRAASINQASVKKIYLASKKIHDGSAPERIQIAASQRVTHVAPRKALIKYFSGLAV